MDAWETIRAGFIMSQLMLQFFYFFLREFGVFTDDIDGESVGQHLSGGCRTFFRSSFCSSFCPSFRTSFRPFREDVIAEDDDIVEGAVVGNSSLLRRSSWRRSRASGRPGAEASSGISPVLRKYIHCSSGTFDHLLKSLTRRI